MREVQSGLVVGLGGYEVFAAAMEVAVVEVGGDSGIGIGGRGEGLGVAEFGDVVAAVGDQFYAEVEPGGGEVGAELDGAAVGSDGLGVVTEFAVGEGLGEVKFRDGGVEPCCGFKVRICGGVVFLEGVGVGEAVVGYGGGFVERQGAAVSGLGVWDVFGGQEQVGVVGPGEGVAWTGGEGCLGHAQGGLELVGLAGDEAQAEQSGLGLRVDCEGLAVGVCGFEEVVLGVVGLGGFEEVGWRESRGEHRGWVEGSWGLDRMEWDGGKFPFSFRKWDWSADLGIERQRARALCAYSISKWCRPEPRLPSRFSLRKSTFHSFRKFTVFRKMP